MNFAAAREVFSSRSSILDVIAKAPPVLYADVLRQYLPKTGEKVIYNEVVVAEKRWLDDILPAYLTQFTQTTSNPTYEGPLVTEVRKAVSPGDTVVVVGGGIGVSTVAAAEKAGQAGRVHVFEGSEKHADLIERTVELNGQEAVVTIHHAIVGVEKSLRAGSGGAPVLDPPELPACDVLELDCEGAEATILEHMSENPQTVVVETHGEFDSPKSAIVDILRSRGYRILNERTVNADREIDIMTATDAS